MRLFRVTHLNFPFLLRSFYLKRPGLSEKSFDEQLVALRSHFPAFTHQMPRYMDRLGVEYGEAIRGLMSLNEAWAKENDFDWSRTKKDDSWPVVLEQIIRFKPDVVIFQAYSMLPASVVRFLKSIVPSLKLVVLWKGAPGVDELAGIDFVLGVTNDIRDEARSHSVDSETLYHSYDGAIDAALDSYDSVLKNEQHDLVFAGATGYGYGDHQAIRHGMLMRLAGEFPIKIFAHEKLELDGGLVEMTKRPIHFAYPDKCRYPVFGLDLYAVLNRSRICFNRHCDSVKSAGANRLFEATGAGTCLLTDRKSGMDELFEENSEVVLYGDEEECFEKVQYLLDNPDVADEIGKKAKARVAKDHLLEYRCERLKQIIEERI